MTDDDRCITGEPMDVATRVRFWQKVDDSAGPDWCWLFTASLSPRGYGRFAINGRPRFAHRIAYELLIGPIPHGLILDHLCRIRACVNPAHLEPVTNRENLLRGVGLTATNAAKTHCPKGHEYTPQNTWTSAKNQRHCRTCRRDRRRLWLAARKVA